MDGRVSRRLLCAALLILVGGSFDEFDVDEGGTSTDQGNEVGAFTIRHWVSGNTSQTAFQNPSAPSPTAR